MTDTRLVLIDGISGSGKSTTAHWLARQLSRNGISARWYHEEEDGHPFRHDAKGASPEDEIKIKDAFVLDAPRVWSDFSERILSDHSAPGVSIVESYLFQYPFMTLIRNGWERARIKEHAHKVADKIRVLNPVLIQFRQADVPAACRLNWSRRGDEWRAWYLDRVSKTEFARSRGLSGEDAAYSLLETLHELSVELTEELGFRHLFVENSRQDWDSYRTEILKFMDLRGYSEEGFRDGDERFAGKYEAEIGGEHIEMTARVEGGRLVLDAFWPGLRLLPVSESTFEMEGFPFEFTFNSNQEGKIESLEVTKSRLFFSQGQRFAKSE